MTYYKGYMIFKNSGIIYIYAPKAEAEDTAVKKLKQGTVKLAKQWIDKQ